MNVSKLQKISSKRKVADFVFKALCYISVVLVLFILVALLVGISKDGLPRLNQQFFEGFSSRKPENSGIRAGILGTLWVISITVIASFPIGVAAAIYLEEFADRRSKLYNIIQLNIANLAAVPSIVFGILGLSLFVSILGLGRSILAAGLTMALLILPLIIIVSQEALRAIPAGIRETSLALGATPLQTVFKQTLPNAFPGIITGLILSMSRAIGETAPLIVVGAVAVVFRPPDGLRDKFTVLPIQIFEWSSRPQKEFHENAAAAILVLLATLIILNSLAIIIRARAQKKV